MDNVLRPFDGREPWLFWLEKFTTVAEFLEWTDVQKVKYLALYLGKVPSRIYQQTPPEERTMAVLGRKFTAAFMPSPMVAHSMLQTRKLREGESCEELWYELVELFRQQTGQIDQSLLLNKFDDIEFRTVVPYFLAALPVSVSTQLRLVNAESDLATLLSKTRTLLGIIDSEKVVGGMATTLIPKGKRGGKGKSLKCYNCGDAHPRDKCPHPSAVCFTCKQAGHRAADCPKKPNGSKNGAAAGDARQ